MKFIDVKTTLKVAPITHYNSVFNWRGDKLRDETEEVYAIELTRRIKFCFIPLPKLSFYIVFNDCDGDGSMFHNIYRKYITNKPITINCIGRDMPGSEYECTYFKEKSDAEAIITAMQTDPNCFIQ